MYKIDFSVSYIEKNRIFAVYTKHNLYFFKNKPFEYFTYVLHEKYDNVPKSFIDYLREKRILIEVEKND